MVGNMTQNFFFLIPRTGKSELTLPLKNKTKQNKQKQNTTPVFGRKEGNEMVHRD